MSGIGNISHGKNPAYGCQTNDAALKRGSYGEDITENKKPYINT